MINFEFIIGLALILAVVGILLSILSSFTESKSGNSSEKRIEKLLPGINCGQCGYPGCQAYAKALADGKAQANLCKPAGADVAKQIALVTAGLLSMAFMGFAGFAGSAA